MKKLSLSQSLGVVALFTLLLLMVPFIAMQFNTEVNWDVLDFMVMGGLLFVTGSSFVWLIRLGNSILYKLGVTGAVGTTLLLIWANLAVGLIGSGPNIGNLMYAGVVGTLVLGILFSDHTARGLQRALWMACGALAILTFAALALGLHHLADSSVGEILGVNAFFICLYGVSSIFLGLSVKK